MNYLNFQISNSEEMIKLYKHGRKIYLGLLSFALTIIALQIHQAIQRPSYVIWACIGSFIANIVWIAADFFLVMYELKLEKERLYRLKNIEDHELSQVDKSAQSFSDQYKAAIDQYERLHGQMRMAKESPKES